MGIELVSKVGNWECEAPPRPGATKKLTYRPMPDVGKIGDAGRSRAIRGVADAGKCVSLGGGRPDIADRRLSGIWGSFRWREFGGRIPNLPQHLPFDLKSFILSDSFLEIATDPLMKTELQELRDGKGLSELQPQER